MATEGLITKRQDTEEYWVSISDMMAGLMMVFLFISVLYMIQIERDKAKIEQIAVTYERLRHELYIDLENEFKDDLERWNAYLEPSTLSISFREPDVLFRLGSEVVRPVFKKILDDFFPRYITILKSKKYKNDIAEIRIEGHTSSEWMTEQDEDIKYIRNMELSQRRKRSVLDYVLKIGVIRDSPGKQWIKSQLTANGLSSSKLIMINGKEDRRASRRVEFRVRTNAERRIVEIIKRI